MSELDRLDFITSEELGQGAQGTVYDHLEDPTKVVKMAVNPGSYNPTRERKALDLLQKVDQVMKYDPEESNGEILVLERVSGTPLENIFDFQAHKSILRDIIHGETSSNEVRSIRLFQISTAVAMLNAFTETMDAGVMNIDADFDDIFFEHSPEKPLDLRTIYSRYNMSEAFDEKGNLNKLSSVKLIDFGGILFKDELIENPTTRSEQIRHRNQKESMIEYRADIAAMIFEILIGESPDRLGSRALNGKDEIGRPLSDEEWIQKVKEHHNSTTGTLVASGLSKKIAVNIAEAMNPTRMQEIKNSLDANQLYNEVQEFTAHLSETLSKKKVVEDFVYPKQMRPRTAA